MKTMKIYVFIFLCILILSCADNEYLKRYQQLRRDVLAHYKAEKNPLKEKAAKFLLDNLKDRHSIEGERYGKYSDTIRRYYQNNDTLYRKLITVRNASLKDSIVKDITILTPAYLIDNIDRAFESWEKAGWKDQISFSDFCEYILPYRIGDEPLESWREKITQDTIFKITGDTIFSFTDLRTAATYFSKEHSKTKKYFKIYSGDNSANIPDLPYSILNLLTTGTCSNLTQISLLACRAAAIPIANDFTPHWANAKSGHDWSVLITKSGSIPFNFPVNDSLGNYRGEDRTPSKVYRNTFSENTESHLKQRGYCKFLPEVLNNPRLIDVTDLYMQTNDIALPVLFSSGKNDFAYLSVSDRQNWVPVAWGTLRNGFANFSKVGRNSVFLPVVASFSEIRAFNYPFILSNNGEVQYFKPDTKKLRKVELLRKNPLSSTTWMYMNKIVHGKFQGAQNPSFQPFENLGEIIKAPKILFDELKPTTKQKFRFVRYITPKSGYCNISEINFFSPENKLLKGKIIGYQCNFGVSRKNTIDKVFDGDVLTYYDSGIWDSGWVGLDFGKPEAISKIVYAPRNDDNFISKGNLYELFYWDNGWKSLGKKVAADEVLVYDEVPSNSLLFLKNHTKGREERIFTYENGKQVWR